MILYFLYVLCDVSRSASLSSVNIGYNLDTYPLEMLHNEREADYELLIDGSYFSGAAVFANGTFLKLRTTVVFKCNVNRST